MNVPAGTDPYTSLAAAITERIATVPGIKAAIYPPENNIEANQTPIAVVMLGGANGESRVIPDMDGSTHHPFFTAQVMVPREGNTAEEFAEVDALAWPICKAFNEMTAVNQDMPSLQFHVDKCQIPRWRGGLLLNYAGQMYYGTEFYFDIKFHG